MPTPNRKILWIMPDNYMKAKLADGREQFLFGWTDAVVTWADICGDPPLPKVDDDYKEAA